MWRDDMSSIHVFWQIDEGNCKKKEGKNWKETLFIASSTDLSNPIDTRRRSGVACGFDTVSRRPAVRAGPSPLSAKLPPRWAWEPTAMMRAPSQPGEGHRRMATWFGTISRWFPREVRVPGMAARSWWSSMSSFLARNCRRHHVSNERLRNCPGSGEIHWLTIYTKVGFKLDAIMKQKQI